MLEGSLASRGVMRVDMISPLLRSPNLDIGSEHKCYRRSISLCTFFDLPVGAHRSPLPYHLQPRWRLHSFGFGHIPARATP
jgi:hypothetical protein